MFFKEIKTFFVLFTGLKNCALQSADYQLRKSGVIFAAACSLKTRKNLILS